MPSHVLLRSQRNDVLAAIVEYGLDPHDLEWGQRISPRSGNPSPVLQHTPTGSYFAFEFHGGGHWCEYAPADDRPTGVENAGTWPHVMSAVIRWLSYVKREYEAPDMWGELRRGRDMIEAPTAVENTPFTRTEKETVAAYLREIKELIVRNHDLDDERLAALDARLEYLEEAASRLGRLDWRHLLVGSIISLGLELALKSEVISDALRFGAEMLGPLFGVEAPVPELPGSPSGPHTVA
jgi:hypothetical protein